MISGTENVIRNTEQRYEDYSIDTVTCTDRQWMTTDIDSGNTFAV
jgi:hypothetical protein